MQLAFEVLLLLFLSVVLVLASSLPLGGSCMTGFYLFYYEVVFVAIAFDLVVVSFVWGTSYGSAR